LLVGDFAHLFVLGIEVKMMAGRFYFGVNCFSLLYCLVFKDRTKVMNLLN
jgi:hypothetical protein